MTKQPDSTEASLVETGVQLYTAGKFSEALALMETFLAQHSADPAALNIAAAAALALNNTALAEQYWSHAIAVAPTFADAHFNLGNLFRESQRMADAEASYKQAITIQPNHILAYYNLARMLQDAKRLTEAEAAYLKVLSINNGYAEVHNNLGVLYHETGRLPESVASYRRALSIKPDHGHALSKVVHVSLHDCRWDTLEDDIRAVKTMLAQGIPHECTPFDALSMPGLDAADHKRAAELYARYKYAAFLAHPPLVDPARHLHHDRLRIGYLSADFHDHATVRLMAGVLEHHNRKKLDVYAYSYGPDLHDKGRQRVINACEHFCDLRILKPVDAARKIADDEIDILVDLKGYTQHSRLEITALRPAPVIISWLGYPGTLGYPRLADYIIGDPIVTPIECAADFSETLALMPHCYQPNDRTRPLPQPPTRAAAGLPEQGFIFCSFNQSYKITPEILNLWCRLLATVNDSMLWLLAPPGKSAQENLQREIALRGIAPDRVVFAKALPLAEHMSRLQLADLALDTYPCTSHTTASDALWAGVPIITCPGDSFVSKVPASLLNAAGLPELIAADFEAYFRLAQSLATNPDTLRAMRERLIAQRFNMPLFDTANFTRDLENIYARIWQDHGNSIRKAITLN